MLGGVMRASGFTWHCLTSHWNDNILYCLQDSGCFVCGLDDGFRIYNTDPLKQNFDEKLSGGIGAVEMLFRCNYVALVGGGITPAFSTNKVVIWDIINHKEVVQLEMNSDVRAVRLRRDRIVVVLDTSVHIFRLVL
ncbi:unnamed protein product [Onchocerca flexuosa]|uniref:WD_REPEATS_REGION domain-containing protein n=1 Tax=Onchocerca flexuosa TaxID=387005 RepID=A0A183I0N8_9BILA|nr:unnamed protein product [Onchocerca flexuosa]